MMKKYYEKYYGQYDATDPSLDFLLNSAEMNTVQPEDLDKPAESSTTVSELLFNNYTEIKCN